MRYYKVHYNQYDEPYIIEKNFGYRPSSGGSSHWTWHITERGIIHISKDFFGRPTEEIPSQISHEQLEDLKAFNMLSRSDGSLLGHNSIYPSDAQKTSASARSQSNRVSPIPDQPKGIERFDELQAEIQKMLEPAPVAKKQRRSVWAWFRGLFSRISMSRKPKYSFEGPTGSMSQKMSRLRELQAAKNATELSELIAALGDTDQSISYLAYVFLARKPDIATVRAIQEYIATDPGKDAIDRSYKLLKQIANASDA